MLPAYIAEWLLACSVGIFLHAAFSHGIVGFGRARQPFHLLLAAALAFLAVEGALQFSMLHIERYGLFVRMERLAQGSELAAWALFTLALRFAMKPALAARLVGALAAADGIIAAIFVLTAWIGPFPDESSDVRTAFPTGEIMRWVSAATPVDWALWGLLLIQSTILMASLLRTPPRPMSLNTRNVALSIGFMLGVVVILHGAGQVLSISFLGMEQGVYAIALLALNRLFVSRYTEQQLISERDNAEATALKLEQAQRALRESEERYQLAIDNSHIGTWDWDIPSGQNVINAHWAGMLGFSPGEIPNDYRAWEELLHPDDLTVVRPILESHLRGEIPYFENTFRMKAKDGHWVHIRARGRVIARDENGEPLRMVGTHVDVSGQHHFAALLESERDRLENTLHAMPYATTVLDTHGNIIFANRATNTILGVSTAAITERSYNSPEWEVTDIDGGPWPDERQPFRLVMESKQPVFGIRHGIRFADGRHRIVEVNGAPLFGDDGAISEVVFHVEDITDRLRIEAELQASERKFRMVVESTPAGLMIVNEDNLITLANSHAESILRYGRGELVGKCVEHLIPHRHRATHAHHQAAFRNHYESRAMGADLDIQALCGDGTEIPVEIGLSPMHTDHGMEVLVAVSDITKRRAAERERQALELQMLEAQKLESLGLLSGGIAHDFNNILAAIMGHADLIRHSELDGPAREDALDQILHSTQRAADLCNQLLAYSGRGTFEIRPASLNEILSEMTSLLRISISKKVEIEQVLAPDLPAIDGDITQLRQIVMNLVINAADAIGSESGLITIATGVTAAAADMGDFPHHGPKAPDKRMVFLDVTDSGCGMNEEMVSRIFDPFFTSKAKGRGLGLAAVRGIMGTHGGHIVVHSHPGTGTTFRLLFPESRLPAEPLPNDGAGAYVFGMGRVLVVDDEPSIRLLAEKVLTGAGYHVTTAEDGLHAVELIESMDDELACVVLDVTMPRMGGHEAYQRIRELLPGVPILLASGYVEDDGTAVLLREDSHCRFLQKPYRAGALTRAVAHLIRGEGAVNPAPPRV